MIIGIDVPDYTRLTFETTFLQRLLVCLLFNRQNDQELSIYFENNIFG